MTVQVVEIVITEVIGPLQVGRGDGSTVATDGTTITGDGSPGSPLAATRPFTAEAEAKLAGLDVDSLSSSGAGLRLLKDDLAGADGGPRSTSVRSLVAGDGVTITETDGGDTLTIAATGQPDPEPGVSSLTLDLPARIAGADQLEGSHAASVRVTATGAATALAVETRETAATWTEIGRADASAIHAGLNSVGVTILAATAARLAAMGAANDAVEFRARLLDGADPAQTLGAVATRTIPYGAAVTPSSDRAHVGALSGVETQPLAAGDLTGLTAIPGGWDEHDVGGAYEFQTRTELAAGDYLVALFPTGREPDGAYYSALGGETDTLADYARLDAVAIDGTSYTVYSQRAVRATGSGIALTWRRRAA